MSDVRCGVCHRVERWSDGSVEVIAPGGGRQPKLHPIRAEFETWAAALRGGTPPVVAPCEGCGHWLIGDAEPHGALTCRAELPGGGWLEIDDNGTRGQGGPVPVDEALAEIRLAYPGDGAERTHPALAMFQGSILTIMMTPALLWVVAIVVVVMFLSNYGSVGPTP